MGRAGAAAAGTGLAEDRRAVAQLRRPSGRRSTPGVTYLQNQGDRIEYDRFALGRVRRRLSAGSRPPCKHVVATRMKRSGMTWSDDGAQDILSLRTAYLNGGWDRLWADEQPTATETCGLRIHPQTPPRGPPQRPSPVTGSTGKDTGAMMLRFVAGRPVSHVTTQFLAWVAADLAAEGKRALVLVWDNASWHVSREVRAWVKAHNRAAKAAGAGGRIVCCRLPSRSPWLNAIEPKWVHGKRALVEPDGKLAAAELKRRVCDYYGCGDLPPLAQKVA